MSKEENKQGRVMKELDDFKEKLKGMSRRELEDLEQVYIKKSDDKNAEVAEAMFDLKEDNYKVVAEGIRMFLNRHTVGWQYTLGLKVLYEYWDPERFPGKINYPTLDSTLRILGEFKFTGYEEWCAVVAINEYMESLREKYIEITESIYEIAAYHNCIMDELGLAAPFANPSLN